MVEVLDTTLRDGEQTAGVSFNDNEKLAIAALLLEELKVNRIEVASARVSQGEMTAFRKICSWAGSKGLLEKVEALGFIDGGISVDWIAGAGGRVMNILAKGSLNHLTNQLHKGLEEHIADIRQCVELGEARGLEMNIYLEDWSNGMIHSPEYVFSLIDGLKDTSIKRFMLPDTLGILNPDQTHSLCTIMRERYPDLHFDFHAHNDYGLALANCYAALRCGFNGVHATVNGLGERSGNTPISSLVALLNDHLHIENTLCEKRLSHVCKYVESISGIRIPANEPVIGDNVFTQSSGVHADGDKKAGLYMNSLVPQRFGRVRKYALGKTSGKANIVENLNELGISLTPQQIRKVTDRVVELGDKKESMTTEDLPFIIADVLKDDFSEIEDNIHIVNYSLQLARGMRPVAIVRICIGGVEYEESASGDGQYDAFTKALWKIYDSLGKSHPLLVDYQVTIPPGGKTDAIVAATITWNSNGNEFKTRGIDSDQTEAAITATLKMLNIIENWNLMK